LESGRESMGLKGERMEAARRFKKSMPFKKKKKEKSMATWQMINGLG
jgi:hypothetical protein